MIGDPCVQCSKTVATGGGRGLCCGCYQRGLRAGDFGPRADTGPAFLELDLSWHVDAACAEVDGDLWFPEKGGSTAEAKSVCRTCLVRAECLDFALETGERFGIWGGTSERERRKLLGLADDETTGAAA